MGLANPEHKGAQAQQPPTPISRLVWGGHSAFCSFDPQNSAGG